MLVIEGREFRCQTRYRLPELEDVELRRCTFVECQWPAQQTLEERPTLRRVNLVRCHVTASDLGSVIAEDCTVDTIWFHRGIWGGQTLRGCGFRHVVIRGNVTGGLRFEPSFGWLTAQPQLPAAEDPVVRANAAYYADVDWALDISEAHFTGIEMAWCDVPAHLIRRDPATQAVVTRDSAAGADWRAACGDSPFWVAIERFLESGLPDTVLVAPRRNKHFERERAALERLRAIGVALPD
jgi:hypothetical protein